MDFRSEHKAIVKYNRKPNSKLGQLKNCGTPVCIYDINQANVKAAEFALGLTHVNHHRCFFLDYGSDCESPTVSSSGRMKKDKPAKLEKKDKPAGVRAIYQQFDNTFTGHLKTISIQAVYVVPCSHKLLQDRFRYHIIEPSVRSMIRDLVRILLHLHSQYKCLGEFTFTNNVVLISGTAMFSQLTYNVDFTEESRKKDYHRLYCELTKLFGSEEYEMGKVYKGREVYKLSADFKHFLDQLDAERPHAIDSTYLLNHLSLLPTVERLRVIKGYAEGVSYLNSEELVMYFKAMNSMKFVTDGNKLAALFNSQNNLFDTGGVFGSMRECFDVHQRRKELIDKARAESKDEAAGEMAGGSLDYEAAGEMAGGSLDYEAKQEKNAKKHDSLANDLIWFCRHLTSHLREKLYHHFSFKDKSKNRLLTEQDVDYTIMAAFGRDLTDFQLQLALSADKDLLSKFV